MNKPSGTHTRLQLDSGVVPHEKPFDLISKHHYNLIEVNDDGGKIATTVYEF